MPSIGPHVRAYGGWLLVLLAAAALAVALLQPAGAQEDDELENPVAFAETSYANVCAECHGGDGDGGVVPGTGEPAPSLTDDSVTAAYGDLVLRTGRMPPPGDPFDNRPRDVFYTDAERRAMVDWMTEEFGWEEDIPEVEVEEGDVSLGLEVFALNCAHCHGNAGGGGVAGERAWTPRINQLEPTAIAEAIRVGPFEMPAFSEDVVSEEEVNAMAAYLEAVDEESGTPVLGLVELNPVFASGFVIVISLLLLGSLFYIGGRPVAFERVPERDELPGGIEEPSGQTPMPGDPEYEAMERDTAVEHEPIPYTDEGKDRGTDHEPERPAADDDEDPRA